LLIIISTGDLPECAKLSGNSDESLDDRDLQRALEDSTRDAKKQRQQHGKYVSAQAILLILFCPFITLYLIKYLHLSNMPGLFLVYFLPIFKINLNLNYLIFILDNNSKL